ncbi:acyl-CoA N-acyltransferase [Irpex lacteus]|nr:acyl-CoA N-acyltransferase [Irpex lacteus]
MFATTRLTLRRYRPSDDQFFFGLYDQYNVLVNLVDGYIVPSPEAHKARLEAMTRCLLFVVVETKDTKESIGFALLNQRNGPLSRDAEIGIGLDENWWGKGYGTEVMSWLVQYAFQGLALHRLSICVWSSNTRAIAMYEHLGFQREGCIRDGVWKEGKFVDKVYMGMLAKEYYDGVSQLSRLPRGSS